MKLVPKLIPVDAWRVGGNEPMPPWLEAAIERRDIVSCPDFPGTYLVQTTEGTARAAVGAWIIRGADRAIYPAANDWVATNFEQVAE